MLGDVANRDHDRDGMDQSPGLSWIGDGQLADLVAVGNGVCDVGGNSYFRHAIA